ATLPIILGEKLAIKVLYLTTIGIIIMTFLCVLLNVFPKLGLAYGIVLIFFFYYLLKIGRRDIAPGIISEATMDGQLIFMGIISLLGRVI
ncbi:MAG: hypothetical protein J7J44_06205, partial [Deltaproteobacteria bacterium]|nr:hypothetical protein [Deltaproteobacteria bacterium]